LLVELKSVEDTSWLQLFIKNSRFPQFCATSSSSGSKSLHPNEVMLIPKLRMHFAEFLNHSSPNRLGILYLSTCVGLGYGHRANSLLGFSRQHRISDFACTARYHVSGYVRTGFAWTSPYTLTPRQPSRGFTYLPASPYSFPPRSGSDPSRVETPDIPLATSDWNGRGHGGTGISTGCASTTPFGLALAPDSPWED